jgi:hypothetical protein
MERVVERVVCTYGMMVNLSSEEERWTREHVIKFLAGRSEDENVLAVEAIKHLRGSKPSRIRRARS